jgi:hypothetical protein
VYPLELILITQKHNNIKTTHVEVLKKKGIVPANDAAFWKSI